MIMQTIGMVVAYSMQNNMYCFTRVAIGIANLNLASNRVLEHTCGLLCVYREILDRVTMLFLHLLLLFPFCRVFRSVNHHDRSNYQSCNDQNSLPDLPLLKLFKRDMTENGLSGVYDRDFFEKAGVEYFNHLTLFSKKSLQMYKSNSVFILT